MTSTKPASPQSPTAADADNPFTDAEGKPATPRGAPRDAPPLTAQPPRPTSPPISDEEEGGPKGPEPTRYGDWERKGRVSDF